MNPTQLPVAAAAAEPPLLAQRLSYAGLIPFVAGALLGWLVFPYPDAHAFVVDALAAYAALIISFLGGIHWGLAMRAEAPGPHAFRWAVVPSLVAWLGVIMPAYAGLVVLGVMLVVCYQVDRRLYVESGLGHWLTLRFRLSAVAAFCCFLSAANA
jgi:hypothetical protein